ncbi:peptidoglycan-binding protein [Pseudomonas sp. LS1212]|uniref:FimV/HubP family polar landmark protein n=1 Tax=Pseudomonas sp. LS1212 TaxID=2972478 RepID=UPI00215CD9C5|nr:FimV/HubP family polar landmark protein [Pseudomonas sp. LS1212]UVJ42668.1 peptidoglycan-binding protein [Pseudomonas sp. LS1212]
MVQVRKLVLAIAAASALSSGMAHALGLGELTLKSTLNQPLVAEIELLDVRDLTVAEVVPSLAPVEEFAKAGVDRQAFLDDLTFTPVINANGKSVVRITSSKPLPEPFVKFLVQVMWPSGRLMRDYSVLLDPSKFSPQGQEAAVDGATPAVTAPTQYTTSKRDTLWEIAAKARQGGSIQQTMLAIQALNPDAFIDGNINLLKTGQVLRLPDQQQVASLPQAQAIAEVAEQNTAWRQGRRLGPRARQIDATRRSGNQGAPVQVQSTDKLSLVSADGKSAGKGAGSDSKALNDKLAVTQESLDSTRRDNAELTSRMTDLQSQMDKLQRLIQLKSDQLAKLEAQGAAGDTSQPAETPAAASLSAELAGQTQVAPAPAETPAAPAPDAAVATPAPAQEPAQAQAPTTDAPNKGLNDLLASPALLGLVGGGALVVSLLLLLLARRRKAQQEAEKHMRMARALAEESELSNDLDLPQSSFEGLEVPAPNVRLAPAFVAASAAAATAAESPAPAQAAPVRAPDAEPGPVFVALSPSPESAPVAPAPAPASTPIAPVVTDAVLAEADQSIANGRFNHATELLEAAIAKEPQRSDLRLKLMEAYAHQGDRDAFTGQERQLIATGKNHADVEELKRRFPAMLAVAAAGISAAALAAEQDAQYVKDLLLDEPLLDEPLLDEPLLSDTAQDEFDSTFDLSLDDVEAVSPAERAREEQLETIDFDDPILDASKVADEDPSFESVLQQQSEVSQDSSDNLADFDLDIPNDQPAVAEVDEVDVEAQLAAFDDSLSLEDDAIESLTAEDLQLPEDFDLSLSLDEGTEAPSDTFSTELDEVNAELERLSQDLEQPPLATPTFTAEDAAATDDELEFDYLSGTDEAATKLDLARAYIDMGDSEGARDILDEVLKEGDAGQRSEAKDMISRLA